MDAARISKQAPAPAAALTTVLSTLRQGDLISLGATTVVGRGFSTLLEAAGAEDVESGQVWSLTIESTVGWYVILSQDCDIVRDPTIEPCLMVCPLQYVSVEEWEQLRHGPYSPREFPYPTDKLGVPEDRRPVVDARVVTSMEKYAIFSDGVQTLRPLSPAQHQRFALWIARRFARAAHSDQVEKDVLTPAESVIRGIIRTATLAREANTGLNASGRVALAVDEWLVGGNDRLIELVAVTSPASLRAAGLLDDEAVLDRDLVESGRAWIEKKILSRLPPGGGYVCKLHLMTLDKMTADEYRSLAPWVFDGPGDPLSP